jgi:hypothetical protein
MSKLKFILDHWEGIGVVLTTIWTGIQQFILHSHKAKLKQLNGVHSDE